MSKKHNSPSSNVDSKLEKTKNVIHKAGEIVFETGKFIVAVGTVITAYKGIKGNDKK